MSRATLILVLMGSLLAVIAGVGLTLWRSTRLGVREKLEGMAVCVAIVTVAATFLVLFVPGERHGSSTVQPAPGATAARKERTGPTRTTATPVPTPTPSAPRPSPSATPTPAGSQDARPATTPGTVVPDTARVSPRRTAVRTEPAGATIRATQGLFIGLCMAVDGDSVVTSGCSRAHRTLWRTTGRGEIVDADGRCMTPDGAGGGMPMKVAVCDRSSAQQWRFSGGRIRSGPLCLTIYGPSTRFGTVIQTWDTDQDPRPADEEYWEPGA